MKKNNNKGNGTHIINVFGKVPPKKTVRQESAMIVKQSDGITITIPPKAIKITGFLKESVAKRIFSGKIEDIVWLYEKYGIEYNFDADTKYVKEEGEC